MNEKTPFEAENGPIVKGEKILSKMNSKKWGPTIGDNSTFDGVQDFVFNLGREG